MSDVLYFSLCGVLVVGVLAGIWLMSKVKLAARGNLLSALCTAGAIVLTMYRYEILARWELWLCIAIGLAVGLFWAYRIKMIEMPQVVGLLNGFGGAASAIVAAISMLDGYAMDTFGFVTGSIALAVGAATLTGSLIAAAKLHKILGQKPVVWKGHSLLTTLSLVLTAGSIVVIAVLPEYGLLGVILCALFSGFFGVAFAIRVGGADMPITISLLNSLSGVAGAIAGMAIGDPLLVAIGGVVGASGLLLTQIMCRAMNRRLVDILIGKKAAPSASSTVPAEQAEENAAAEVEAPAAADDEIEVPAAVSETIDHIAVLKDAKNVIIIPGYGMALAQAQRLVKELADILEGNGATVSFAIHPVAGRMPGHMNVLLAEVDVDYDNLLEMDDVNPMFETCDVAIVIGANDVINPAANTAEGTPIYGMPILNADKAKHLIICNYDLKPGYAGVENPLYHSAGVVMLTGDAAETLQEIIDKLG